MLMTANELSAVPTQELMQRKRALENGLATASMHGVEAPVELLAELKKTQDELSTRIDCSPAH